MCIVMCSAVTSLVTEVFRHDTEEMRRSFGQKQTAPGVWTSYLFEDKPEHPEFFRCRRQSKGIRDRLRHRETKVRYCIKSLNRLLVDSMIQPLEFYLC
jgi:hypothetical protein